MRQKVRGIRSGRPGPVVRSNAPDGREQRLARAPFPAGLPPPAPASPWPRPAWPASPCPASPGRGPGKAHLAGRARGDAGGTQKRETGNIKRPPLADVIISRAPPHIVLQAWCCISLGVRRKVRIGRCLREGAGRGFRCQQVSRMEYGSAGGKEPRQDRRPARCGAW